MSLSFFLNCFLTSKTEMNIIIPVTIHSADILATGVCIEFSEQFGSQRPMLSPAVLNPRNQITLLGRAAPRNKQDTKVTVVQHGRTSVVMVWG